MVKLPKVPGLESLPYLSLVHAARSVFVYDMFEEHSLFGMYEVKIGEMATYGLAATKVGTAEYGTFKRCEHDRQGEMAKKMMGYW